jgi:hypothetical protein
MTALAITLGLTGVTIALLGIRDMLQTICSYLSGIARTLEDRGSE